MNPIRVACAFTGSWVAHAAVTLLSAIEHRGDHDLEAVVLHGEDVAGPDLERLRAMVEGAGARLRAIAVPPHLAAPLPHPKAQWYRTLLPDLLPDARRALYLDVDTIVLDDLGELWETDLGVHPIGAVSNVWEPWNSRFPTSLGLPDEHAYFNSGVLLMHLAAMRAEGSADKILAYARDALDDPWADQTPLNVVFAGRWLHLHPRWNAMNSVLMFPHAHEAFGPDALAEARARPAIRHFEGPSINKPWHLLCTSPGRDTYLAIRQRTPWPRVRKDGVTPWNLLRRAALDLRGRSRREGA